MQIGDIPLGETLDVEFDTTVDDVPTALAGSPALVAYVGNSTTEFSTGLTLDVTFDTRVGLNHVRVVATAANGYTANSDVDLVFSAGTLGGVSLVNRHLLGFSITHRTTSLAIDRVSYMTFPKFRLRRA